VSLGAILTNFWFPAGELGHFDCSPLEHLGVSWLVYFCQQHWLLCHLGLYMFEFEFELSFASQEAMHAFDNNQQSLSRSAAVVRTEHML